MLIHKDNPPERTEIQIQQNKYYMFDDETLEWVLVQGVSPEDDLKVGIR